MRLKFNTQHEQDCVSPNGLTMVVADDDDSPGIVDVHFSWDMTGTQPVLVVTADQPIVRTEFTPLARGNSVRIFFNAD